MRSVHAMVHDEETGMDRYDQERNSFLVKGLTSTTGLFRRIEQRRDNSRHATEWAAREFLTVLNVCFGGYAMAEPEAGYGGFGFRAFGYVEWSEPLRKIRRPDGETFDAGRIGYCLGNEAAFANERQRDFEICALIGQEMRGPLADGRWLSDWMFDAASVPKVAL